ALLLVAIDPLPAELLAAIGPLADDAAVTDLLPAGADYLLTDGARAVRGSAAALADRAPALAETGLPDENDDLLRFTAGPGEATLLVYLSRGAAAARDIAAIRADEGESADDALPSDQDLASTPEPLLPLGLETVPEAESAPPPSD